MYTAFVLLTPSSTRPSFVSQLSSCTAETSAGRLFSVSDLRKEEVLPGKPIAPRVVIDWAGLALDGIGVATALELLLEWVRTSPEPSAIQVVLPPVRRSPAARRLQGSLQSLGCTVTLRNPPRHLGRRYSA